MKINPELIEKFLDPLSIPPKIDLSYSNSENNITLVMSEFYTSFHSQMPKTKVWGYNNSYPGPTICAKKNTPLNITWINNLPDTHLLANDCSVHGVCGNPDVRTVVHLHGAITPPEFDGYPDAWFTKDFKLVGPLFVDRSYHYPNLNNPCTLWYHDHAIGITRLNVYAGLLGMYIVEDDYSLSLNLPKDEYDIPLVIQDKDFNSDGGLFYPRNESEVKSFMDNMQMKNQDELPSCNCSCPINKDSNSIVADFFGSFNLVNGIIWPYLEVEPRKYRFRVLNGSNGRFYNLKFGNNANFIVIGSDLGFLKSPVLTNELLIAPAERYDIIVDFSNYKGECITLLNSAPAPYISGDLPDENTGVVMQFRVSNCLKSMDTTCIPKEFITYEKIPRFKAAKIRKIFLKMSSDYCGRVQLLFNNKLWKSEITETPKLGETEIWEFINLTDHAHPVHVHLVHFFVLRINKVRIEMGNIVYENTSSSLNPIIQGPKDTIIVPSKTAVQIIATFKPFEGLYEYHCHILEHEDNEMMRPFRVKC